VVLYEEALDQDVMSGAIQAIRNADLLMIGGTSMNVWPAAGLVNYYRGNKLVLVNRSPVAQDRMSVDLLVTGLIGEVLSQL
jgi:NAD-dependent deacetylase